MSRPNNSDNGHDQSNNPSSASANNNNSDPYLGANVGDASWMKSGFRETIRQRAHAICNQFYDADDWTSDQMERRMYDTEDEIVDAYGEEKAAELLEHERAFLEENVHAYVSSVAPALLTTAASMLALRRGAPALMRGMGRYRSSSSTNASHLDNAGRGIGPTSGQGRASGAGSSGYQFSQPTAGGRGSRLVSTLTFATQLTVSSMLGLAAFDYAIGRIEENDDAPRVPLQPGISITSMYKCPAYMSIYGSEQHEGFWDSYKKILASEEDEPLRKNLAYYEKWAVNCARRDIVEQKARMELERMKRNQLAPGGFDPRMKYVPIPLPGVPEDLPVKREKIGKQSNRVPSGLADSSYDQER